MAHRDRTTIDSKSKTIRNVCAERVHRSLNTGMCASTKAKGDSQEHNKEGRRKSALIQLRPSQQLHKMVSNVCERYKLSHFLARTE